MRENNQWLHIAAAGILLATGYTALHGESSETILVKDGKAAAGIVISKNPVKSARFAACELQHHIKLMTGAELPITDNENTISGTVIYVGESEGTRKLGLKRSSFGEQESLIRVKNGQIVLMGADHDDHGKFDYKDFRTFPSEFSGIGSCYAVWDFLRKLGVRWYLPTELGTVYNTSKNLCVTAMEIRRKPFMEMRNSIISRSIPADFAGAVKKYPGWEKNIDPREQKLLFYRWKAGGKCKHINHSLYSWFKRGFGQSHPEYFAKGYPRSKVKVGTQLCYTDPAVIRQASQDACDFLDGKNTAMYYFMAKNETVLIPIVPMDNSQFCRCPNCKQLEEKSFGRGNEFFSNDRSSEYFFTFVNAVVREVGKTHPEAKFGTLAYDQFAYPPKTLKLDKNIEVQMCLFPRDRGINNPRKHANDLAILKSWQEMQPENPKSVWMYYCFPAYTDYLQGVDGFPGFFADHIPEIFHTYIRYGVRSFKFEPSYRGEKQNFLMDQLETYITYRLGDNPDADAKALIEEFFSRYYGKAGGKMKQLYREMEEVFCQPRKNVSSLSHEAVCWSVLGTPERMAKWQKLMDAARQEAAADKEIYRKRVAIWENGIWRQMLRGSNAWAKRKIILNSTMKQTSIPKIVNREPGNPKTLDWNQAGQLPGPWQERSGKKFNRNLKVSAAHDGQYFYLRVEDPVETAKLADSSDWGDGCELFFGIRRGKPIYQLCAGTRGSSSAFFFGDMVQFVEWNTKSVVVTDTSNPHVWCLYVAVPLDEIGMKPGKMLYFNLLRNQHQKNEACWIPTFAGHIEPSRLGEIYLNR